MARDFGPLRLFIAAALIFSAAGCDITQQERVQLYNEDGIHQFSMGNYREAADSFEQARLLKPEDPVLVFNIGQAYDRLGKTQQAEAYYQDALKQKPGYPDARQAYANLLTRTNRSDTATQLIQQWTREEGNQSDALVLQAWKLRQENRLPEAYDKLQAALAQDPHNPRALVELGILYERMNFPERSLVLYQRVLAQNPNLFEVRERANALKAKGVTAPLLDQ